MLIAARNALMAGKRLPYDAEVEYLESTGTQWIDTGIVPHTPIMFDIGLRFSSDVQSTNQVISRVRDYSNRRICPVHIYHDIGKWEHVRFTMNINNGNANIIPAPILSDASYVYPDTMYRVHSEITASKYKLIVNDVDLINSASSLGNISCSDFSMRLLSDNWAGTAQALVKGKLYYCSILMDGILIRDFIPVRFTNEQGQREGAMYNRLGVGGMDPDGSARTDGLYRNRGTGDFVLPDA